MKIDRLFYASFSLCCLIFTPGCGAGKMSMLSDSELGNVENTPAPHENAGTPAQPTAMAGSGSSSTLSASSPEKSSALPSSAKDNVDSCDHSGSFYCGTISSELRSLCRIYSGKSDCDGNRWSKAFYDVMATRLKVWQAGEQAHREVSFIVDAVREPQAAKRLNIGEPVVWRFDQSKFRVTHSGRVPEEGQIVDLWLADTMTGVFMDLKSRWHIAGIDFSSVYRPGALVHHTRRTSRHAYGLAMDIRGFYLDNGRYISVAQNWRAKDDSRKILRNLYAYFKENFNMVLGPSDNRDHRDHFHVDLERSNRPISYRYSLEWPYIRGPQNQDQNLSASVQLVPRRRSQG